MPDYLKLPGGLFFILFVFISSTFAQTSEVKSLSAAGGFSRVNFDKNNHPKIGENSGSFSKSYFETKSRLRESLKFKKGAADEPTNWKLQRGAKELNVELGYSPITPTFLSGRKEYDTSGRTFGMLNLRWGRVIGTAKSVTYEYQIEITPIALAFNNEVRNPAFQSLSATPNVAPTIRKTTYGLGFSPVGFRFLFKPKSRLKPFIAAHAGFIFFRQPVPLPDTLDYDFTGDFGGGLQYQIKKNKAVSFGYKYFHISNINIGKTNPGYNANVF